MHTVQLSKDGVKLGSITFRGIAASPAPAVASAAKAQKRLYKCNPHHCIENVTARQIAAQLSQGVEAGQQDGYDWRT